MDKGYLSRRAIEAYNRDELVKARAVENDQRLRTARAAFGHLVVRICPQIRRKRTYGGDYVSILGRAWILRVPEAVDVWDLLRDLQRFMRAWRPERRRTDSSKESARQAWEKWERSAGDLLR